MRVGAKLGHGDARDRYLVMAVFLIRAAGLMLLLGEVNITPKQDHPMRGLV